MALKRIRTQVARPRKGSPITYSEAILRDIAEAIGRDESDLLPYREKFELAARTYESDAASPTRTPPSIAKKKLQAIAAAARKLLGLLGIHDPADAPDGPGDLSIFEALAQVEGETEDTVLEATARVGRLVDILKAAEAAIELERMAQIAADDVTDDGALIAPKVHLGDAAENAWIAAMMEIFAEITGKPPGTSVVAPARAKKRGIAEGPLIRFLEAAGQPLGISYSPGSSRSRIRTIKKNSLRQK